MFKPKSFATNSRLMNFKSIILVEPNSKAYLCKETNFLSRAFKMEALGVEIPLKSFESQRESSERTFNRGKKGERVEVHSIARFA